ncbi:MAG TPA: IPTL-CTERM sorting domain-containing protein, partial [Desulfobacteria bacterium]|nr:IPTL-CTERM sorting domain-containing protein [Desulfobacteria bacterium]
FSYLEQNNDRDHDGISDEEEATLGTNPDNPDSDGDGLIDGDERAYMTNPLVKDTDGDTFSDFDEIEAGSDPLDPNSIPSAPIPTLNEWGTILFGLLFLGSTVLVLRKRRKIGR